MLFDIVLEKQICPDIMVPLLGEHQANNCALAFALCKDILGEFNLNNVRENLTKINWPGRMEIINNNPFILLDACINSTACKNIIKVLDYLNIDKVTLIVGIPDDKDYMGVVKTMKPKSSSIILTKSENLHYIFTQAQQNNLQKENVETIWTNSVPEALDFAIEKKKPIVILGTTSVISEVKKYRFI